MGSNGLQRALLVRPALQFEFEDGGGSKFVVVSVLLCHI